MLTQVNVTLVIMGEDVGYDLAVKLTPTEQATRDCPGEPGGTEVLAVRRTGTVEWIPARNLTLEEAEAAERAALPACKDLYQEAVNQEAEYRARRATD
jgi:hypothetical protein